MESGPEEISKIHMNPHTLALLFLPQKVQYFQKFQKFADHYTDDNKKKSDHFSTLVHRMHYYRTQKHAILQKFSESEIFQKDFFQLIRIPSYKKRYNIQI